MSFSNANLCAKYVPCCRCLLLAALIHWLGRGASAGFAATVDPAVAEAATAQLVVTVYQTHPGNGNEASSTLYRTLYWMYTATQAGVDPSLALIRAQQRAMGNIHPSKLELQLVMDLSLAETYGLFTPTNLACLQGGVAPTATLGPFAGKRINAVRIRPTEPDYSLVNTALCPENSPLSPSATAPENGPTPVRRFAGEKVLAPTATMATAATTTSLQPPPPTPAPYRMTNGAMIYPGTTQSDVANAVAANPAARLQLSDLPFNAMLPVDVKIKLGIAKVDANEITVSVIGRRQVLLPGPVGGKDTYHPSVEPIRVPKTNPTQLSGVSGNAYLIYAVPATNQYLPEIRWYFIDTTINNGTVFRIARVVGPF